MKIKYNAVPKSHPSNAQYMNDMIARKMKMIGRATHTGALICASADSNSYSAWYLRMRFTNHAHVSFR